jgi:phosphomannomutase
MSEAATQTSISDLMAASGVGFGTSGARGLADAMTDRVCYLYTLGFLQYLEQLGAIRHGGRVALAGDFRPSSPRIMAAAAAAIAAKDYRPVNCGNIPSPALASFAIGEGIASLMVTGSHIPDDRNGIKFNLPQGEILKADETGIRAQELADPATLFDAAGAFVTPADALPAPDDTAYRLYLARYLDVFPADCLHGSRVLVYEHSSVAAAALREVFAGLGAEVVCRGYSTSFIPVDTEAVREEDVALARSWAAAEHFDLLVSADGDGDRPLVGDEQGEWLRGDVAGVLAAHYLGSDAVVTPVSSNTALEKSGWFRHVVRTRIGSPYVIAGMQQAVEAGAERVAGYEANGGFLTMSTHLVDGRSLPALPTRDALVVALAILLLARRQGLPVSRLAGLLPPRFTASDRLKNFPTELSQRNIMRLARDEDAIFGQFPAMGPLESIDQTDGLRITFANGEIIHLRPSGNAPELRCYTEADSADRARVLNQECLALLDSWRA